MINNELKQLQSRRKRLIENISNIADDIAKIDKELGRLESDQGEIKASRRNPVPRPSQSSHAIKSSVAWLGGRRINVI